jgi:hypothetical protein
MHAPGQFGSPAMSAFAPLCTRRERSQIGTGNRVRTGELPIRVDQFLAIRAEKLCEALAYFGEDIGAMMALVDRALAINPNFARGWHVSGVLRKGPNSHIAPQSPSDRSNATMSPAPGVSHQIIALPRPCETGAVHIWVPVAVRASTAIFR